MTSLSFEGAVHEYTVGGLCDYMKKTFKILKQQTGYPTFVVLDDFTRCTVLLDCACCMTAVRRAGLKGDDDLYELQVKELLHWCISMHDQQLIRLVLIVSHDCIFDLHQGVFFYIRYSSLCCVNSDGRSSHHQARSSRRARVCLQRESCGTSCLLFVFDNFCRLTY